jgi:outer membrane protein OmpA-like peptidoglycan-associated protein
MHKHIPKAKRAAWIMPVVLGTILWSTASTYWYVCEIKELCEDDEIAQIIVPTKSVEISTAPTPVAIPVATVKVPAKFSQLFLPDSIELNGLLMETKLSEVADYLKANTGSKVDITGYVAVAVSDLDSNGLALSRAKILSDELIRLGVSPSQIMTGFKGDTSPISDNNTEEGRAQNRRVEVIVK